MVWPGRVFRLVVLLYVQTLVLVVAVELLWPRDSAPAEASAIVCLGGGASQGALGSDSLQRAQRCVALYHAGTAPRIIFTGTNAAPLMADVARAEGVPGSAIAVEDLSRSTLQNALFTAPLVGVDAAPAPRVIVVSQAYHLPRSWIAFRVMGFEDIALAAAGPPDLRPRPLLREGLAIWFNFGRVAMWWVTPWLNAEVRAGLMA